MAGDSEWKATVTVAVLGWMFSPVITFFLPKILACLGFDASKKLQGLEIHTIPELKKTLQAVDQERMMQRGKRVKTDLDALDKMAAMLRHALEDAEDIFDDAQHKSALRCCHHLRRAFAACVAICIRIASIVRPKSARLRLWAQDISLSLFLRRTPEEPVRVNISAAASDNDTVPVTTGAVASDEPDPVTTSAAPSDNETVLVTTGAVASDELDPATTHWIAYIIQKKSARLLQWARDISLSSFLRRTLEETDPVTTSVAVSDDEIVQVTIDIPASGGEPYMITTSVVAYETVPVTTSAAASGEHDQVTASAAVTDDEIAPMTTGVATSNEPDPVATGAVASGEHDPVTASAPVSHVEIAPMTTGVAASNEPDPVTTSVAASGEHDHVTTSAAVSDGYVAPMSTGAATSDEPDPVTSSVAASCEHDPVTASATVSDDEIVPVTTSVAASDETDLMPTSAAASDNETVPVTTGVVAYFFGDEIVPVTTPSDSSGGWLSCLCTSFDFFKNYCTSLYSWLGHLFEAACSHRDLSYEMVGIKKWQENASLFDILDIFLTAISRVKLKKRIQKVENTVSEVKKSPHLGVTSNSTPNDIANKYRRGLRAASKREVFGREALRDDIMARLRETPRGDAASSRTSPCYSVIGIYGVAGSGKTTFAGYIRDYIKEECKEKLFDTIMCIHVSETFSVDDIFNDMLKDITEDRHSNISDREELEEKLKEALRGKCFFLILDDLWVKNKNDQQLEELISPLNVGSKGSKILVTARTKDAAGALCADELIEMPDLDEDQYLKMFMHYALGGKSTHVKEFDRVGILIAKKLHRSPIAAVTVAGRLGTNRDMNFWKNTANHETFNETFDALWWSYQQLNPDIRRCFEYCNIFPRRSKLNKHDLVRLWIAQGFVKTSCATEDMGDVAEGYIQELVSCSFLQPKGTDSFVIHDLLHDLIDKIVGSDCLRIDNERSQSGGGWKGDVPRDVRHLFVQNYDVELITEKILGLEYLRTLIIDVVEEETPVEEKVIECICKRLRKLRVLAVAISKKYCVTKKPKKFSVPKSIAQLKHLRYLAFRTNYSCSVILPSALSKLHHIQLLDFDGGDISEFPSADLINLQHMICGVMRIPNLGRLISLQTLQSFSIRNKEGYEIRQLRDLNKLRGSLWIHGLENVKSKEEALEANLAAKEGLTELCLAWGWDRRCSPEVEAEVLSGLCPPVGLQKLLISDYKGSRYPDWMVGEQSGGPEGLQNLCLWGCTQLGPGPEFEAFPHLRVLQIWSCSWDSLPGNMEHLTLLKQLHITGCKNIRSLPTLPQSIEVFHLTFCNDEFMKSCKTAGHPNWQKIEHIPWKAIG